jgi:DNA-binding CsgD family transcriptional regulator
LAATADRLIVRAPALAVDLLERAVTRPDLTQDRRADLRLHLARALMWVRRPRDAERTVETALAALPEPVDPARLAALRWLLAQACFQRGHLERAVAEAQRALRTTGPATAEAARWHGFLAQCRLLLGQAEAADASATAAQVAAGASNDVYGTAYGLYIEAGVRMMERRSAEGVVLADRALAVLGAREIHPDLQMAPYLIRGFCLFELDRYAEADEAFELGLRQSERGGHAFRTWHHMGRARLRYLAGRWDDALAEIDRALEVVDPFGMAEGLHSLAALIALHRGDFTGRGELLEAADHSLAGRYWGRLRLDAQVLAQESAGDPHRALDTLLNEWGSGWSVPSTRFDGIYPDLARLALTTGRTAELHPIVESLGRLADEQQAASTRALEALCRGAARQDVDVLRTATDWFRQAGRVLDEGYGHECVAMALAGHGRVTEARTTLNSALDRYERLGAAWDIGRAEGYLRLLGGRRRRARPRPRTGWDALTATERRVATFVAEGRSNPDIAEEMYVSRRTVQSHVSSILAKLGLTSRVELAVSAYAQKS